MDSQLTEQMDEPVAETPEDVAILYSWANLHGAKYRDFSASRREYRAQVRHRAAEDLRESELNAQAQAEAAAAEAERVAREAERAVRSSERLDSSVDRGAALRNAEEASRRASAERVEAARRAESAAVAEAVARREEREIAEAHSSAQRQAARWNDSEVRLRGLSGTQPRSTPSLAGDPYEQSQGSGPEVEYSSPNRALDYTQPQRFRDDSRVEQRIQRQPDPEVRRARGFKPDQTSGVRPAYRPPLADSAIRSRINPSGIYSNTEAPRLGQPALSQPPQTPPPQVRASLQQEYYPPAANNREERAWQQTPDPSTPAWLYASNPGPGGAGTQLPPQPRASQPASLFPPSDSLQHSRERVASRWFALKGVFEAGQEPSAEPAPRQKEMRTPCLAVFSLAGGVGKTSLVATLGRTLSSLGEKVLLADTTSHGLLPYYFGATELRPGVVRTFSPPSGSPDAAIHLVSYEVDGRPMDRNAQDLLARELTGNAGGTQRLLLDLNASSGWLMRHLLRMAPTVLVPVAPDMNSVISLQTVERYFHGADGEGRPLLPYYVLNQFDASLPLHLDVREVLRRQLGERLLPNVIRRSPAVSEALAEGMTVIDYSPESPVTEDYGNLANWLRSVSAPATHSFQSARWSER